MSKCILNIGMSLHFSYHFVITISRNIGITHADLFFSLSLSFPSSVSLSDPGWTSINRGVLICDECCSVHRSLGRHISIVKHLRHSGWPPALLQVPWRRGAGGHWGWGHWEWGALGLGTGGRGLGGLGAGGTRLGGEGCGALGLGGTGGRGEL